MTPRLQGRVAVVTGAANGIGRASALCLAQEGADVAVLDRPQEEGALGEVVAEVERLGRRALPLLLDCREESAVAEAFSEIHAAYGDIDILFNNVGQSAREKASEFWLSTPETWRFVIETTLITTMLCTRQVVERMRARRQGRIINMSSEVAFVGDPGVADYAAAKMGVVGFTRSLARELAPFGITVNVVCPGLISTRAHARMPADLIERLRQSVPLGFAGEPEDVGHTVAFLASDHGRYITGQSLLIDGGRWMV